MTRLPFDPIASHRAAPFLARLVACGLLGRAEALAALLHAAAPVQVSASGRHARIIHAIDDVTTSAPTKRAHAAAAARAALRPLIEAGAPRRTLLATARNAASPALTAREIESLTIEAISRHLRARRNTLIETDQNAAGQRKQRSGLRVNPIRRPIVSGNHSCPPRSVPLTFPLPAAAPFAMAQPQLRHAPLAMPAATAT